VIGPNAKGANLSLVPGTITIAGVQVGGLQLTAALTSLVVLVAMTAFLTRSTLGISMRATADNFRVAQLMGIRANRVIFGAFLASGLMAGIAGVLWVSQRASVDPLMGMSPVLKAFVAVIIGGMGSLSGAVLAALMLGALEVGFQTFLPGSISGYRDAVVWLVVIAVLLWRPDGLFAPKAERV
jgi:branched-chain amino acid transport system permease protein